MSLSQRLITFTLKAITSLICRIEDTEIERVPDHGPFIIYTNHINILEIPIIYTRLQPRHVYGLVLAERWRNPILRWILNTTQAIPIRRASADVTAMRKGLEVLARGDIIAISPEGTRSHDGILQTALPGVILLALHANVPLLPIAYHGAEKWLENLSRLQRTDFHIRVGNMVKLVARGERVTHAVRQQMVDELMTQLAALLPEDQRGKYAEYTVKSSSYLTTIS